MRKLIESTHVSLGGEIGSPQWAFPYLDEEHNEYAKRLLFGADALLLGRLTYEGLSAAYPAMTGDDDSGVPSDFVERMNSIPKYVASTTLRETVWNATVIDGDVAPFVSDLKQQPGGHIIKYGNGPLDITLMEHGLIDEFHLLMTPVAIGRGQHMFEEIENGPALNLVDVTQFSNGVVILTYTPRRHPENVLP